jgi:hypothetical protein
MCCFFLFFLGATKSDDDGQCICTERWFSEKRRYLSSNMNKLARLIQLPCTPQHNTGRMGADHTLDETRKEIAGPHALRIAQAS